MECGRADGADLRKFVAQYRHFVAKMPWFLADLVDRLPGGVARECALKVLESELGLPSQLEIFDRSAAGVGAEPASISPAMDHLLTTYDYAFEHSDRAAFTALIVPGWQSAERDTIIGNCVRRYYGEVSDATAYWRLHSDTDQFHAQWMLEGLEATLDPDDNITPCVRAINGAWWQFFNEQHSWSNSAEYSRHRVVSL
jgi:pyrroloquinoline quinone (PQQ) biosynthesis protein C